MTLRLWPNLYQLEKYYGIESGYVTTLHPRLSYQKFDGSLKSVSNPGHNWKDYSLGQDNVLIIPKVLL